MSDGSTLRRLNEELEAASEELESENDILRYENEQNAELLRVDARNRLYSLAAREVYGTQKKFSALLDGMTADAPDHSFRAEPSVRLLKKAFAEA